MAHQKKAEKSAKPGPEALVLNDCQIWTGNEFREGSILIENGKIRKISRLISTNSARRIDARGLLALPGLIDAHVHLRDMELSYKEDFTTGTSAAAAGGFTSILDMPNSRPPVDSPRRLEERIQVASRKILVNVGFHAAMVRSTVEVRGMAAMGAFSLKLYMPRPISPLDMSDDEELLDAMRSAASSRIPVTVHAEEPAMIRDASSAQTWPALARTRPWQAETRAVKRMLRLQQLSRCSIHFAHITLPTSIALTRAGGSSNASSEVTPHHLLLSEPDMNRLKWKAWMVPPLRTRAVARQLLSQVSRGMATLIASDHAPHTIDEKKSGLGQSPPGVPGLETTLPLLLTMVHRGKMTMRRMIHMLTIAPAQRFCIRGKGKLGPGGDADIVLVNPTVVSKIDPMRFLSKAKYSPFEGFETRGRIEKTIVGGEVVFDHERIIAHRGTGTILTRHP